MFKSKRDMAFYSVLTGAFLFGASLQMAPDPLTITESNTYPDQEIYIVKAGDTITFYRDVTINKDLKVDTTRLLTQDGSSPKAPAGTSYSMPVGDYPDTAFQFRIPDDLGLVGEWTYRPSLTYRVNPLLTITKQAPGFKFEVIE